MKNQIELMNQIVEMESYYRHEAVSLKSVIQAQGKRITEMRDDFYDLWVAADAFLKNQNTKAAGDLIEKLKNNSIHVEPTTTSEKGDE